MRVWLLGLVILGVLGAGTWYVLSRLEPLPSVPITENETVESSPDGEPAESEAESAATPPHPVSIEALRTKTFDGRDFAVGRVLATEASYTRYYISYKSGELTISGIMNVPKGDGPFPVLFLNHGYIDPAVYTNGRGLRREQDYFARQGFVVVHSDYRNHAASDDDPEYQYSLRLGYAEDVINAIEAIKVADLPYVDRERVGMFGHSMGGGIAQVIAVAKPELVDAIVLYAPVSGDYQENFERYTADNETEAAKILERYGTFDANPEFWAGVSPRHDYDRLVSPVVIHIGTEDDSTPPQWSRDIDERLRAAGKDVTLYVYDGEAHEFGPQWGAMMERSAAFFREQLG